MQISQTMPTSNNNWSTFTRIRYHLSILISIGLTRHNLPWIQFKWISTPSCQINRLGKLIQRFMINTGESLAKTTSPQAKQIECPSLQTTTTIITTHRTWAARLANLTNKWTLTIVLSSVIWHIECNQTLVHLREITIVMSSLTLRRLCTILITTNTSSTLRTHMFSTRMMLPSKRCSKISFHQSFRILLEPVPHRDNSNMCDKKDHNLSLLLAVSKDL